MAFWRCIACKADVELGKEAHCILCHRSYQRGTEHLCSALDRVIAEGRELAVTGPRTPWAPMRFADHEVPKE